MFRIRKERTVEQKQSRKDLEQWTLTTEQRVLLLVLVLVCFWLGFFFFVVGRLVS